MGRIAPGYRADLLIAEGDPFLDQEARLIELWIEGERFALAPEDDPRGRWRLEFAGEVAKPVEVAIGGSAERPEILPTEGETGRPIRLERSEGRFAAVLPAARLGLGEGQASFGFAIIAGRLIGELALAATPKLGVTGARVAARTREAKPVEVRSLSPSPRYPAGEYGREGPPPQPEVLLLRGATIWTMDDALGRIEGGDLLVERGRIRAVGRGLQVPPRALVLDVTGKHLTPGIVDAHSHTAIAGGLNEASHAVTSEVRIADVIDPTDINLYRQLAGGVTAALLLHGSANPIGGQSAVIKLRWGESAEGLLLADAPPGIKFALGENVKQSNWGDAFRVRYPQTRMGVEQIFEDRFSAAREYLEARRRQRKGDPPLRRDLRLEALAEILEGKRLVHIHSYVQSEIAMFARLAERWGIRVATFQHVLEGYKVSEEIRRIGAGASSFADWWAFKFEVYDAIPHNAAMLTRAGVLTSINSDSNEHARRLNTEAAKAVRYGGLSEVEALALVTRNPAEQLGLGQRIGRPRARVGRRLRGLERAPAFDLQHRRADLDRWSALFRPRGGRAMAHSRCRRKAAAARAGARGAGAGRGCRRGGGDRRFFARTAAQLQAAAPARHRRPPRRIARDLPRGMGSRHLLAAGTSPPHALAMKLRLVSALPMLAAMALASAQNHVTRPLPAPEGPVVIENVVLHPVSAPPIARGWLRFEAGRITGLGAGEAPTEDGVLRVDAEGLALYPGLSLRPHHAGARGNRRGTRDRGHRRDRPDQSQCPRRKRDQPRQRAHPGGAIGGGALCPLGAAGRRTGGARRDLRTDPSRWLEHAGHAGARARRDASLLAERRASAVAARADPAASGGARTRAPKRPRGSLRRRSPLRRFHRAAGSRSALGSVAAGDRS